MNNKFYITTPIYYVNDVPHIGHTCTTVAADIIARYHKLLGDKVFLLTGTDEHGAKVAQEAEAAGMEPQLFCDKVSQSFSEIWPKLNIGNDYFIRTTNPDHKKIVQEIVNKINENGDVYKGKYEGWYCLGCEKFITESEIENKKCPFHPNKELKWQVEDNYFFKLTKYVPTLIEAIENPNHPNHYEIIPEGKKKEVLARLKAGINDISISRSQVAWGIPLPWDHSHTIYVWIEALFNYYSALKINDKLEFWPADVHLLAKDILWFHAVVWQALLLSVGFKLPKQIFIHSFYTIDGQKMSKSLGNVISPQDLIDKYGVDGARYLIASTFPAFEDSDIGWSRLTEKYNADLANGLGNLVARVAKLAERANFEPSNGGKTVFSGKIKKNIEEFRFNEALSDIWAAVGNENKRISDNQPWKLDEKKLNKFLEPSIEKIRQTACDLQPFMPETAEKILAQFKGPQIKAGSPLFPRIK